MISYGFYHSYFLILHLILHYFNNSRIDGFDEAYRPVMLRPSDLEWKFVHYNNPDQRLIPSDLDRLKMVNHIPSVGLRGI